jgi:hypothetical protein
MVMGGPKKGNYSGFSEPTFVTAILSRLDYWWFGTGMGSTRHYEHTTSETLAGGDDAFASGSVLGMATSFGGGQGNWTQLLSKAGGEGSGRAATGADTAFSVWQPIHSIGTFTGTGAAMGDLLTDVWYLWWYQHDSLLYSICVLEISLVKCMMS